MSKRTLKIVVNKNTPMSVEFFSRIGEVVALDTPDVAKEAVRDADVLIVRSETKVNKDLLDGSSVRFVGTVTIGTDHVDLEYLGSENIAFASAPGSNANSVAEYVVAALLVWSRRTGEELRGKTIGIVGVGNVGSKVAPVARTLGLNVLLNDPPLARATGDEIYRSLDELMKADCITLHVPLTNSGPDATFHFFDETRILKMKPGGILINTSRGGVVDTQALSKALRSKHLSAAILDVWEDEPNIDTKLLKQVMIGTPHIAGYSLDGKLNALSMVYESVCRHFGFASSTGLEIPGQVTDAASITVSEKITEINEILYSVVRQAYDIELDDYSLREIESLSSSEQARYFMRLRGEYKIRREFFNRVVELSPEQVFVRGLLNELGFKSKVKEEARWVH